MPVRLVSWERLRKKVPEKVSNGNQDVTYMSPFGSVVLSPRRRRNGPAARRPGRRRASSLHRYFRNAIPALLLAVTGCWLLVSCRSASSKRPNVVLISIDTCRADYLGCYGYPRQITPNIDRLARESTLFANAYTPIPMTLPAHASMLTGTIPPYHGVRDNIDYKLSRSDVTLAEILSRKRFVTGAVISAFVLDSQFGLDQGFDYYNDRFEQPFQTLDISERRGEEASRFALEWLDKHKDKRFFLFLHYYDPHTAYVPPEPFASEFEDSPYAGEIAYTDYCIGKVLAKLKDLGLYDSTLIIVVGDHGEMLGEHGESDHMYFIYQSAIKVPLIFKLPGRHEVRKVEDPVGIIDIVPTVCSTLGIRAPERVQGRDLSGYFEGNQPSVRDRHFYCESMLPTKYGANPLRGVVAERWKYIQTTRPELYDLVEDPAESTNLVEQEPDRARILADRLQQMLEESVREGDGSRAVADEETRRRLESLGYAAGGGVSGDFGFDPGRDDPKDLLALHELNGVANVLTLHGRFEEARAACEKMLKERPHAVAGHYNLARLARAQGDFARAASGFAEVIRRKPDEARAHNDLGDALIRLNRNEEAVKHLEEAVRLAPECHEAYNNLGIALRRQRKYERAIACFRKTLEIYPESTDAHNNLGNTFINLGKPGKAIRHYSEALRIDPKNTKAHRNLANALADQGRADEAIGHLSEALRIDPRDAEAHNDLGCIFLSEGRSEDAVAQFRAALRIRPDLAIARHNLRTALRQRAGR